MSATEIVPHLWQASQILPVLDRRFPSVIDLRLLEDLNISILDKDILDQQGPFLVYCPLMDEAKIPPIWKLEVLAEMIVRNLDIEQDILVHCEAGHNRSGLVVAYYLIEHEAYAPLDAINLIRTKRPGSLSNQTFVDFLLNAAAG